MKNRSLYAVCSLLTAVLLTASPPIVAQQADGQTSREGIQVHGHWTVEVYDGDELVQRREFENDLMAVGANQLVNLFTGSPYTVEGMFVLVEDPLCLDGTGSPKEGVLLHPSDATVPTVAADRWCPRSTLNVSTSGSTSVVEDNFITMEGSFAAEVAGSVTTVRTLLHFSNGSHPYLTGRTLTPIDVVEGQEVRVTVVLSFG